jgi:ABC-type transporter Mla subunit MlaD
MRRIAFTVMLVALTGAALLVANAGADDSHSYRVELDNAFGLVSGSEVRVAGVNAGTVEGLDIDARKKAVVTISVSGPLSSFRESATCSAQPQSLIAEYFLDCQPGTEGDELPDDGLIPVHSKKYGDQTFTTVQTDLVQNTLREPFKERLALIFNEFGTALAGNPDELNAAIRRGAPALQSLRKALAILARQNTTIRDLNANSDQIISRLAQRRQDVIDFIRNANRASEASAERRADLSENFRLLPGFLAELRPNLARLGNLAVQQTPLLADLDSASGQLYRLTQTLPRFNDASVPAIESLGQTAEIGQRALSKGKDEIQALRQSTRNAYPAADQIANFLVDLDNPKRAVEVDARAAQDTGRPAPTGYTGLEGLLNYAYYQTLAINQFDTIGHLLHFIVFEFNVGPCGQYNAKHTVPAADDPGDGSTATRSAADKNRCVSWLGPNQPQISQALAAPPYDPSVCPNGSADLRLCNPAGSSRTPGRKSISAGSGGGGQGGNAPGTEVPTAPGTAPALPNVPQLPGLPDLPQLPGGGAGGLGGLLGLGGSGQGGGSGHGGGLLGGGAGGGQAPNGDLLNFLFGS